MKRGFLTRLALIAEALSRMTPRQVLARLLRRGRARWLYPALGRWLYPIPTPLPDLPSLRATPWNEESLAKERPEEELHHRVEELAARRFSFLGLPALDLGDPVDWSRSPAGNRLWQYELHYGQWALDLAYAALTLDDSPAFDALLALLDDWLAHNPVGWGAGWEPYTISRRLVAWSRLASAFDDPEWDAFWSRRLEPSLRQQACFLAANLEYDVPNNHLLANFRALAWVGLLFSHWPESQRLQRRGLNGLWYEMEHQVLDDGVHEERSISYHTLVLQDLHDTWLLAQERGVEVPATVEPTLAKMVHFLTATQAPDGSWPMVNDSVVGSPDPARVLARVAPSLSLENLHTGMHGGAPTLGARPETPAWTPRTERKCGGNGRGESTRRFPAGLLTSHPPSPLTTFPKAGYAVLHDGHDGHLFFDAGPMGPRAIPGHGHADFLSFELYGAGRALVVDPGTNTYEAGPHRDAQRSMAAHNTVTIDDVDPCVFWGPFRVAWPPTARLLESSENHLLGEHHGYRRLRPRVLHQRRIDLREPGIWEILDQFETSGEHSYTLNLQLTPGANLEISEHRAEACWPDGIRLGIHWQAVDAVASREEGAVAAGWNQSRSAPRLVLRWQASGDCVTRLRLQVS